MHFVNIKLFLLFSIKIIFEVNFLANLLDFEKVRFDNNNYEFILTNLNPSLF